MNESPAPTVSLMATLGAGAQIEIATLPQRRALGASRDADAGGIGCFRQSCAGFGKGIWAPGRIERRFAGIQPGSELTNFVIVEFDDIGTLRDVHDQRRIGEGRAQIYIEEFHGAFDCQQAIQLIEVVW